MKVPVVIHYETTSHQALVKEDRKLPSDVHLVRYRKPTWKKKEKVSAMRAQNKVDIFDHLHDRGYVVIEITSGYGRIRPNCFNTK